MRYLQKDRLCCNINQNERSDTLTKKNHVRLHFLSSDIIKVYCTYNDNQYTILYIIAILAMLNVQVNLLRNEH